MLRNGYVDQSAFEHRFWLQILGDHSRFIFSNLAPNETQLIQMAQQFIATFDHLLACARQPLDAAGWRALAQQAIPAVDALRDYKLDILRRHLMNKVDIGLTPTFFNHMLNELEDYRKNLSFLAQGQMVPAMSPIHHHLLWLSDAIGHAETIYCRLDDSQNDLRMKAKKFMELWEKNYSAAQEFAGFSRTGLAMYPSLGEFDMRMSEEMSMFKDYLEMLKCKVLEARTLGSLPALIPDHMAREECYYLYRLFSSDPKHVAAPKCDPGRPRVQS